MIPKLLKQLESDWRPLRTICKGWSYRFHGPLWFWRLALTLGTNRASSQSRTIGRLMQVVAKIAGAKVWWKHGT